ncbi:hypothetical protein ZYGR_0A02030 [Zygosaccharomyces rouxii]|uniref:ZYRO0A04620p n=2 Tax=Zygosaccharomyces rouxii TaxID=4956 RepID=C5DPM7_ZYGRC|nr:uncharacterized protein ZYRO0A04620g [Zygosaccharomyces rouxii]KAH9198842.1 isoprenoid synthase domain-containing protein [Zygosaccharomyces rouxii]GAV46610.1 hypothetical protein ZYGR_0A02030 [Zygosaccharomyces rouxii]CAR25638.1 ZYRO0A04620p [Zygosaccharomyces rouxii]
MIRRCIRFRICVLNARRGKSSFSAALAAVSRLVTPSIMLRNPVSLVSNEMNTLAKNIMALIGSGHPVLNRVTSYYFEAEGKKVRPLLVLLLSRALAEIPLEQRTQSLIDSVDVPEDPVYSQPPKSLLFEPPANNLSPLDILHGIKPLNPLTKGPEPIPEANFDKERGILPKQRRLAEIVEMIHTASLLHDDVIDHSDTRRGRASGNVAFTNKMAVLAGDFLLGRATVAISRLRNPEVVELMSNSIANLVEGEFMQLKNTAVEDISIINQGNKPLPAASKKLNNEVHDYRVPRAVGEGISHDQMIETAFDYYLHKTYLKTAALISKSSRAAAILSGVDRTVVDQCYEFGKDIGICFQLVDDMLDFTVSAKDLGKPAGADLELGIATAPVLYAWKADPSLGPLIQRNFSQPGDVEQTAEAVANSNGVFKTKKLAEKYRDQALQNLRKALPESDARSALEFLTNSILTRGK